MASNDSEDNPLPVNVVPMVDVIFCLCVFFLASFQVRALESRLDTWLPKERGEGPGALAAPLEELRVVLGWDARSGRVSRRFGLRDLADAQELAAVLRAAEAARLERHAEPRPLILDAEPGVPWAAAIEVVDLGRELGIERLEFAQGPR
jgi:biopolymer transport protein ExbD